MSNLAEAVEKPARASTPYELIGGEQGLRRLVNSFYQTMDTAPEAAGIRALHGADLGKVSQLLFEWLSGWLGGPPLYIQHKGVPVLPVRIVPSRSAKPSAINGCSVCDGPRNCEIGPELRPVLAAALFRVADMVRTQ